MIRSGPLSPAGLEAGFRESVIERYRRTMIERGGSARGGVYYGTIEVPAGVGESNGVPAPVDDGILSPSLAYEIGLDASRTAAERSAG